MKRVALFSLAFVASPAVAEPLHLVCLGAGSANRATGTSVYAGDNRGNTAWGSIIGHRNVPFDDQVNIEIGDDGKGRIRLPRAMLPPLHGGSGGWFHLKHLSRTDTEITGSAAVNFMNSPKVRLDRVTGQISISGKAGDYAGECQAFDPATAPRRF